MSYDVIIVGSGAGGSTLAHALAPTGLKVLVVERGDYLRRNKSNWNVKSVFVDEAYTTQEHWLDKDGKAFRPGNHYYVGGNTKFYGAALLRFRESDFRERRHYRGVSPAWPIEYAELEPYYTRAEQLYHVHGLRGSDPTEPPASAPYAYPPVSHEPRVAELEADLRRLGLHPFNLPVGVMLDERNPEASKCIRCATCDGFACLVDAKADAHVVALRSALMHENVALMTNAYVKRIEVNGTGRDATGVVIERDGKEELLRASIVVVSAGAVNSAALFLRSANDKHPNGLANGSDMVGRNYMAHNNSAMIALSKRPNTTEFQKTLGVNDYYYGDGEFDFPMGHVQMLGKSQPDMFHGDAKFAPAFVLEKLASHALDFWFTSEDLPDPNNRVTVGRDGTIRLSYTENNLEGHNRLIETFKQNLEHLGCESHHFLPNAMYLRKKIPIAGVAHQNGTIRFGNDPSTSALDVNCKAHDLDNLYVVDGSFFVSSTAVNPALTIMANALRVGDHLKERFSVRDASYASA
ncbi:MAG: GMC family oxidoreductase [Candidatus Eremiobacteraeota bacterium]|nr:GMC family oxidoreductase [Candidatus Eremiobacteraeota bacterium]